MKLWQRHSALRHAFASLLIHEGGCRSSRSPRGSGTTQTVCLDTFAHVIAEQEDGERVGAEERIASARRMMSSSDGVQLDLFGLDAQDG